MFVKMLTVSAGPGGVVPAGTVREVSDDEGKAIIDGRFGEQVSKPPKKIAPVVETAETAAPENASVQPSVRKFAQRGG